MLGIALVLFAIAILGGLTIAVLRLRGVQRPPLWMALAHGLVAATGLGFLIYEMSITTVPPLATLGLVFLLLAALGGALMFFGFDLQGKALPIPLMLGHGLMAVAGFVMLLIYHYQAHEAGLRP